MIVAVDGRHLRAGRGIARYTRGMATALAALPGVELRTLVPRSRAWHASGALLGRPSLLGRLGGDLAWLPAPAPVAPGGRYVLTVHDLSWLDRPSDFTAYERVWHRLMHFERLLRRASAVVADAPQTAAALESRFGVTAQVVEPGVDVPAAEPEPLRRGRPYYLYVGALEPRKGLATLADGWRRAALDADLLIAGSGRQAVPGATMLGAVGDDELGPLYAGAEALLLPSLLEGYGLTVREAAVHGVPAIVSDLPELRVPGTLRFAPGDAGGLAAVLRRFAGERQRLVAELPAPRSWQAAAQELAAVLAEAAR